MIPRITWSALFEDWLWDKTIRNDESGLELTGISLLQGHLSSELEGSARADRAPRA